MCLFVSYPKGLNPPPPYQRDGGSFSPMFIWDKSDQKQPSPLPASSFGNVEKFGFSYHIRSPPWEMAKIMLLNRERGNVVYEKSDWKPQHKKCFNARGHFPHTRFLHRFFSSPSNECPVAAVMSLVFLQFSCPLSLHISASKHIFFIYRNIVFLIINKNVLCPGRATSVIPCFPFFRCFCLFFIESKFCSFFK